ncbi:MAG: DMT family transporter [Rubrivivax sp.]|nr:DMT family transporter [Rubrivivax sp.]
MVGATLLFSLMGAGVKLAFTWYSASEIVMYRGLIGAAFIAWLARSRGEPLRTPVPAMHLWRSVIGVLSLGLWFYSIGGLPLGTAVTLNYMSSVWMALFLIGGMLLAGQTRGIDGRLVAAVIVGFAGVALVLRPTLGADQLWHGLAGLLSGVTAAMAYLQVTALGRIGEPETRVVFYFSVGSFLGGAALAVPGGLHAHSWAGAATLLGVGLLATLAQLMMTRAYAIGPALGNAALSYLGVAFSFVLGVWLFDDPVTWLAIAGMLLIVLAGLAAAALRSRQGAGTPHAET